MIYVINYFFKTWHIVCFAYVLKLYGYAFGIGVVFKIINDLQHVRINEPGVRAVYDHFGVFWQIGECDLYGRLV